jgi:hypothetical protein
MNPLEEILAGNFHDANLAIKTIVEHVLGATMPAVNDRQLHVHVHLHAQPTSDNTAVLAAIADLKGELMVTAAGLQATLAAIDAATTQLGVVVGVVVSNEAKQLALIADLKAQLAAGAPVTQEQLDAMGVIADQSKTHLEAVSSQLTGIAADPNNPVPEPPPPTPEPAPGPEPAPTPEPEPGTTPGTEPTP